MAYVAVVELPDPESMNRYNAFCVNNVSYGL
jgi:hypothetical protein